MGPGSMYTRGTRKSQLDTRRYDSIGPAPITGTAQFLADFGLQTLNRFPKFIIDRVLNDAFTAKGP